nr:tetratricopeptide repeat protein [Bacteroidota bacterium]
MKFLSKNSLIVIIFIFLRSYCPAQEIDSLMCLLDKTIDRKARVDLLNTISKKYYYINYDSLLLYAEETYKEAVAANYIEGEIKALHRKCQYYMNVGEHSSAVDLIKQAEFLAEKCGNKPLLAESYMIHGDIFSSISIYDKAFKHYTTALDIFKQASNLEKECMCMNRIGMLYGTQNKHDEALEIFHKALKRAEDLNNQFLILTVLGNIAITNTTLGNYQQAMDYYQQVLEIYLLKRNYFYTTATLNNMASLSVFSGDTVHALIYFNRALEYADIAGHAKLNNNILFGRGYLLYQQNELNAAVEDLTKVFDISEKSEWADLAMKSAHILAMIYETKKDYRLAYELHKKFTEYLQIVESEGNTKKLAELQFKYDFEKETLMINMKNRRKTIILKAALIVSVVIVILIFTLFIHMRTRAVKAILKHKNLQLEKDKLKLEQQNLTDQLELGNKEITSNIILLQKKNDIFTSMADKLIRVKAQVPRSNREVIERCIDELRESAEDSDWKDFEAQFNQVYESFYQKLDEINPSLTLYDRRLCAYLRL